MEDRKRQKQFHVSAGVASSTKAHAVKIGKEEATQISRDKVFNISLVTDCIFQGIKTKDLLSKCSFVSTAWNKTVREYISRRRKCLFNCYLHVEEFQKLEKLYKTFQTACVSNCLPFSGINFIITPRVPKVLNNDTKKAARIKLILEDIISSIRMTYTFITLQDELKYHRWSKRFIPGLDLLLKNFLFPLLSTREIRDLEIKSVFRYSFHFANCLENVKTGGFSALENIETRKSILPQCGAASVQDFEAILRTCPKIKIPNFRVPFEAIPTFEKYNKLHVIKTLWTDYKTDYILEREHFNALSQTNNTLVHVSIIDSSCWTPEQFQWLGEILQLHSKSLQTIFIGFHPSLPETLNNISDWENTFQVHLPALPFVKEVRIRIEERKSDELRYRPFRIETPLRRIFPNARLNHIINADSHFYCVGMCLRTFLPLT